MKGINFIHPIPHKKEREVRRWCWLTMMSSSSAFIAILIYTGMQWSLYRSLAQEKIVLEQELSSFSSIMEKQRKQGAKQEQFKQTINKLTKYKTAPKNPVVAISLFHTIAGPALQGVTISKQQFTMRIHCTNAQQANLHLQNLMKTKAIHTAKLVSLQADKKQVIALCTGELVL